MRLNKMSAWLVLSLAIAQPMSQAAASQVSLDSAIQDLQYALTVEWDQDLKNTKVRDEAVAKFTAEIETLRKQGVSDQEIINTLKTQALDANTAKDLEKIAKTKNLSQKEKVKAIQDAVINGQKQGAQWSGAATGILVGSLVAAVLIVALLTADSVSVGYYDPYYDYCYYDYYYGYVCDPYYYYY